jgi:HAD superfamily hydrolase (TIGR01509 family)
MLCSLAPTGYDRPVGAAAILDVDGTLVDSNYQHAIAWFRALREHDVTVPVWRLHRLIGVGGDQLVARAAGKEVEERLGDAIRESESRLYGELIDEVVPFEGARELIVELRDRDHAPVLASSAKEHETQHYIELLDAGEVIEAYTTSADVERTKPEPDLVATAMRKAGELSAVMVGDSTWDVEAAGRAGLKTIAVLTGGFSDAELRDAGAVDVFESLVVLRERLDSTPLR